MDMATLTLREALDGLDRGDWNSEGLVVALLRRMETSEPEIRAFLDIQADDALTQARAADRRRAQGESGRLLGIPLAVKDNFNVMGQTCTCASRILEGYRAPYDATAIARLRREGAVFLGRTNMDEFAMGSSTEYSARGATRNPRNSACVPGGSSGGSAAAVAAGSALAALGSDTGGSIRQPAAFCGCVGLKPSYGRISRYGLTAFASSLDQIGPLTRSVEDAARLFCVMTGVDPCDSTTVDLPAPDPAACRRERLDGVTLGLPREYFASGVAVEIQTAVAAAALECEGLGATVREVALPHTDYSIPAYYIVATAEASANLARYDGVRYGFRVPDAVSPVDLYSRTRAAGFGMEVKRRIMLGSYVLSSGYYDAYYLSAQKVRTLIRDDFTRAFRECDALLTPTTPTAAFRLGEKTRDPVQMYLADIFTATANLAGICALSLPCGLNAEGLPLGLQIIGPSFGEDRILGVASALEQAWGGPAGWEQRIFGAAAADPS
jgi:aspartyl-tRNA(Asn)/glutamyl-tRNA(Gln) amidotransferase subunit A